MSEDGSLLQHSAVTPRESFLYEKTRDTPVLIKTVGIILIVGVLLSWVFGYFGAPASAEPYFVGDQNHEQIARAALRQWQSLLKDPDLKFADFLDEMPDLLGDMDDTRLEQASKLLDKQKFPSREKDVAEAVFDSLAQDTVEPSKELTELANKKPPIRYAQQGLGIVLYAGEKYVLSARAYEREGLFPEAEEARKSAISIYADEDRLSDLDRLMADPVYQKLIDHNVRFKIASKKQQWLQVLRQLIPAQYESVKPEIFLLALLSGLVWLTISCRLLQIETLRSSSFLLCLSAFCLGVTSTWPTVFNYTWMQELLGLTEKNEIINDLVFYIFGVGLNEESMKLLCFLPLVPFLLKRDNQLEILVVAGCVGLGFAAEENVMYFGEGTDGVAARFVTANFLHISATGLSGLALCRAISHPTGHVGEFFKWFGGVVLIHALYDFLLGPIADWDEKGILSIACYIFLCYKFFGHIHELRPPRQQIIGLNFIFLTGLSILVSLAMTSLSALYGFQQGMSMIVIEITGVCIVCYLFVREFSNR